MIIQGRNAIEELLKSNSTTIEKILIAKGGGNESLVTKIKQSGAKYQFVDRLALDKSANSKGHQGFIAYISDYRYYGLDEILEKKNGNEIVLLLDGIEDPHNLGNIIRTAECMGVHAIIIPKNRSTTVTETVIKVSAGATAHMRVCKVTNINSTLETLKDHGFWTYACELGGTNIAKENFNGKVAIVIGGEHSGVRHQTKKNVDVVVSIPMHGKTNSLNAATATAMILYEVNRQRGG
ncbi:MAG: 23S rRNA (guanosine(2251)-2'-O)-methyltransferase RlmB [Firmicutes bacterium]|nr:23S rRNA (guanosine(2251)-2'-O)-methyltransferase RlmB [Bacillota bacterium]